MQRKVFVGAVVSAVVVAASLPAAAGAWAPAATATIHPGVQTLTNGGQCTANFIYQDSGGTYIGQAAHCSSTGEATDTDGCLAGTLPLGTPVEVTGATRPGTLVYSSWVTMQANGESDPDDLRRRYDRLFVPRNDGRLLQRNAEIALENAG